MDFKIEIAKAIAQVTGQPEQVIADLLEVPKESSHGDISFPCFTLAKDLKKSPTHIAKDIAKELQFDFGEATPLGPYVNIKINNNQFIAPIIEDIIKKEELISKQPVNQNAEPCTLIESPSPNTNKPLHLGHLRNMLLGSSLTALKRKLGTNAQIVNLINDRGVHICKSMLAYQRWGNGQTPESTGEKSDHFVGDWYVKFNQEAKLNPQLEHEAQEMLVKWEQGDEETINLWKMMNEWTYQGFNQTYETVGFHVDKNYYESEIYTAGRDIILQGVEQGVFTKDETGAVIVDLTDKKLDKKILLRKDGTAVYITQDIYLAKNRFDDYHFDELVYVVGNEQEYHFKVLFEIFKKLNFPFAEQCKHFSYGMIELPSGKMKSREGNVIDTDELIAETIELAKIAVKERFTDLTEDEVSARAHTIAHGAIRFFFLKFDPVKNFVFDPQASLSFEGETGPYVQYTHARIASILRKSEAEPKTTNLAMLKEDEEKEVAKLLSTYPDIVKEAGDKLKPNLVCNYLLNLCQSFNSYYSKHKIIQDDKELEAQRLALIAAVNKVIKDGLELLGIQAPERM